MKLNSFFMIALGVLFCACEDTLTNIGSSIRPGADELIVNSAVFDLKSSTFLADSIFVMTPNPLLGEINQEPYGTIRADYAAQFYAPPGFNLNVKNSKDSVLFQLGLPTDSLLNNKIDSAVLNILYTTFIGDSLTPMGVTAYELTQQLPENFYSNVDFTPYITPLKPIGKAAYTGKEVNKDQDRKYSEVSVILDEEIKERFFNAIKNTPQVFKDQDTFEQFFPGVYLKNTFGNGTILQVGATEIVFHYRTYHRYEADRKTPLKGKDGKDSSYVVNRTKYIAVTPDVIQLNNVSNPLQGANPQIMNNDSATYLTTPGGYFTEVKIPVGQIMKKLKDNKEATFELLNGVNLDIKAYEPKDIFTKTPPPFALLIQRNKMNEFFEKREIYNNETSFMASLDTLNGDYGYNFKNINKLILKYSKEFESENGRPIAETDSISLAIVPVSANVNQGVVSRVSNYFVPGGIMLKGGKNPQKTTMVYTLKVNP